MKTFNSLSELSKHLNTSNGQQAVFGQKDVRKALREAASLLEKIMHDKLQEYYNSYSPVIYERTYNLLNSLRISPIEQSGNMLMISVYFDRDSATHPSIFGGEEGYVANLINEGWKWNHDIGINHLSHYEGFHFIEKSIDEFNSRNKWGFVISKNSVAK
jgi:hypothetical protein